MIHRFAQFCYIISAANRAIVKIERDEMEARGYKGPFAQYLVVLCNYPDGLTSAQLSEVCDRDKAAVSRAVAEMEEMGLVYRLGNRYRAQVCLTDEGREVAQYVCERAVVAVTEAGKGLSDADRKVFYAALQSITDNLQTLSRDGLPREE